MDYTYVLKDYKKDKDGLPMAVKISDMDDIYDDLLKKAVQKNLDLNSSEMNRVSINDYDKKNLNYFEITYQNKRGSYDVDDDAQRAEYFKVKEEVKNKVLAETISSFFEKLGNKNALKYMASVFSNKKLFDKYDSDNVFNLPIHSHIRNYLGDRENIYLLTVFSAQERLDKIRESWTNTRDLLVHFENEPAQFDFFVKSLKMSDRMQNDKNKFEFYQVISTPTYRYVVSPKLLEKFAEYSDVMQKKGFNYEVKETFTVMFSDESLMSLNDKKSSNEYASLIKDFELLFARKYPEFLLSSTKTKDGNNLIIVDKDFSTPEVFIFAFTETIKSAEKTDHNFMSIFEKFVDLKKYNIELKSNIEKKISTSDSDDLHHNSNTGFKL